MPERRPQLDALRERQAGRGDAHDFVQLALDPDLPADDRGIAAKAVLPEVVADHGDEALFGLVLIRPKGPAR